MVAVRRTPVRSEVDREGRRAGDLPEVPAFPVGGQLSETPSSDEGGEERDLTGRRPSAPAARSLRGRNHSPDRNGEGPRLRTSPGVAERNGRVMTTTEPELRDFGGTACRARAAPSAAREARRVPAAALGREAGAGRGQDARPARVATGLVHLHGRLGVRGGHRESALKRNAEVMAVEQVSRWRPQMLRIPPDRLEEFDELIAEALNKPGPGARGRTVRAGSHPRRSCTAKSPEALLEGKEFAERLRLAADAGAAVRQAPGLTAAAVSTIREAINGSPDRSWIAARDMALCSLISDAGPRRFEAAALTCMPTPPLHREKQRRVRHFGRGEKATCTLMIQDK